MSRQLELKGMGLGQMVTGLAQMVMVLVMVLGLVVVVATQMPRKSGREPSRHWSSGCLAGL